MIVVVDPFEPAASLGVMAKVRKLGERLDVIMFGGEPFCNQGISRIYMVRSGHLPRFVTVGYAAVVCRILKNVGEGTVLFPATPFCKSLAPRVAAKLECGLTADCTDLELVDGQLLQYAPAFSGNALATIVSKDCKFRMATVLAACPPENVAYALPEIIEYKASLSVPGIEEYSETVRECDTVDPFAEIILSAGYGIGSRQNFDRLRLLAEKMGASLGATLAAVNAGFAPSELLIGQTGRTVSPRIYIAFGISGHIQHTVGISASATLVSVNTDAGSAMSMMADYAVAMDAASAVEMMLNRENSLRR